MRKIFFLILLLGSLSLMSCGAGQTVSEVVEVEITTPDEAIAALMAGNKRFVDGNASTTKGSLAEATALVSGQDPFALVIGCSDSRVPVELLFDQGFGDIFVLRNAGNSILDSISMGSLDYGALHLDPKVIVVLGHSSCGAMTALVSEGDEHGHDHGDHVAQMIGVIAEQMPEYAGSGKLDEAIMANIDLQVSTIEALPYLTEKIESGELKVVGAYYNIADGTVTFIE